VLERPPPTPGAIRSRARRARRRAGIERDLRVRAPTRRLAKAIQAANPRLPVGELSVAEIEVELQAIVDEYMDRWLGKRPHA